MSNADDQQVNDTVIVYIMSSVWSCIIILCETSTSTSTIQAKKVTNAAVFEMLIFWHETQKTWELKFRQSAIGVTLFGH